MLLPVPGPLSLAAWAYWRLFGRRIELRRLRAARRVINEHRVRRKNRHADRVRARVMRMWSKMSPASRADVEAQTASLPSLHKEKILADIAWLKANVK